MRLSLMFLTAMLVAGCKTPDDTDPEDTDGEPGAVPVVALTGAWVAVGADDGPFDADLRARVEAMAFEADDGGFTGRVRLYGEDPTSAVQSCPSALFALGGDGGLLVSSSRVFQGTKLVLLSVDHADLITLSDETGATQTFERVPEVPAAAVCGSVTVQGDQWFEEDPGSHANLLFDGTDVLLPVSNGSIQPADLEAGTLGAGLDYGTTYEHLVTMQGTDGWGHCACGGSDDLVRTAVGGVQIDEVDVQALAGFGVDSAAWTGTHLYVGGYSYTDEADHLAMIDSEAEPDVLVSDQELLVSAHQLVMHDGMLLAITNDGVVEMDPSTGKAAQTWALPDPLSTVWWRGITSDGPSVLLSGSPEAGGSRVVRLTLD